MNVEEFEGQLESARIEGRKLFGDDVMLLEKFVEILRYYYFICFRIMILLFLFIFNRDLLVFFGLVYECQVFTKFFFFLFYVDMQRCRCLEIDMGITCICLREIVVYRDGIRRLSRRYLRYKNLIYFLWYIVCMVNLVFRFVILFYFLVQFGLNEEVRRFIGEVVVRVVQVVDYVGVGK